MTQSPGSNHHEDRRDMRDTTGDVNENIGRDLVRGDVNNKERDIDVEGDYRETNVSGNAQYAEGDIKSNKVTTGSVTGGIVAGGDVHIHHETTSKPVPQSPQGIPQNLPRTGAKLFVGRDEAMQALHEQLQATERVAITSITGMGGIGKTELALQYAYDRRDRQTYPGGVCWLQVRGVDVGIQIINLARSQLNLNPPEDWDLYTQVDFCWRNWLPGEVLIVFDDVTNYEEIEAFLPPAESRL